MHRALRRVGWGVLAAAALGMTGPASAQPPAPGNGYPVVPVRPAGRPGPGADGPGRSEAVQVELAWLGDPLTSAYQLVARPSAGALEVYGCVPSATVRQRALDVARANTTFPVVDRLQTNPDPTARPGGTPPGALQEEAAAFLTAFFPEAASGFTVRAGADGRVTVSGTVASPEEKLAVSRRLRWLGGCTGVDNRLEVGPAARWAPAAVGGAGGQQATWQLPPTPAPAPAAPPVEAVTATADGAAPYVSSGTVILPRRPDPPVTTIPVAALTRRIESVCGRTARGVEVVPVADDEVEVRLRVASINDGGRLSARIITLPELAKYHVDFRVRVEP